MPSIAIYNLADKYQCCGSTKIRRINCDLAISERGISYEIFAKTRMGNKLKEVMIITAKPGAVRGNHYHKEKIEWLGVISGRARFVFMDNKTKQLRRIDVSGSRPVFFNIPNNVAHAIINTGKQDIAILEFSNRAYNKKNTDNYPSKIV